MREINRPIAMIAVSEPDGALIPMKFQVKDADGEPNAFPVKVTTKEANRMNREQSTIKYRCSLQINGIARECEIHYRTHEMRWFLYRMN